jgi:Transposase DDE domain
VAHDVTQSAVDCGQLVPMTDAIETNLGRKAEQLSADAGYCSEANLEALENRNIDAYVATGRARDAVAGTGNGEVTTALLLPAPADIPTRVEAMHAKIRAGGHASPYRLRKQLPEPVFGQIKQARGFRQFLLRGIESVRAEWAIVCTVHNLLKLALAKLAKRRSLSAALSPALAAR